MRLFKLKKWMIITGKQPKILKSKRLVCEEIHLLQKLKSVCELERNLI